MDFHKLAQSGNGMSITHKKPFPSDAHAFKTETIKTVFDFAFDMTFGDKGEHRNHRTGGTIQRKKGEIFANTFQGKLAECAACNLFYKIDPSVMPDFSISKLGVWDSVDVVVNGKKIAVKSTKSFGNLLLLEQHDWDERGQYIPNQESGSATYDYFLLIRIKPFCEDVMRGHRWLYANEVDRESLWTEIQKNTWTYDYAGYISLEHLRYLIRNSFVIHKGDLLNGGTRIDADNYYVQAGDMPSVEKLLLELQPQSKKPVSVEKVTTEPKPKRKNRWFDIIFRKGRGKMEKKLIYSNQEPHSGYGAGSGDTEVYHYECPCGKGKIVEEHDNIPGFRDHDVYLDCAECSKKYKLDTSGGVRNWKLIPIDKK